MAKTLKVWTCTDHAGEYPIGVASLVVAATEAEARCMLDDALARRGLLLDDADKGYTLQAVDLKTTSAYILRDGNY